MSLRTCMLVASLLAWPVAARAQPLVVVRAETRIELRVDRDGELLAIDATLRDDRGTPLADRSMTLQVAPRDGGPTSQELGSTDPRGRLGARFALPIGTYRITARYAGDDQHRGVQVEQVVDLSRSHLHLRLGSQSGERLDLDAASHTIRANAESAAGGAGLEVELASEVEQLAVGVTDARGQVEFTVPSERLGPPAAGRLVVRTRGDATRAPAQTEMLVVRYRATALSLEASAVGAEEGRGVRAQGQLSDSQGGIARRAVGIFDGPSHRATVLTDDEGRFSRMISVDEATPRVALIARFESDAPWRPPAESAPVVIVLSAPTTSPWWWLAVPMAVCAVILAFLSRRGVLTAPAATGGGARPLPPGVIAGAAVQRAASSRVVAGVVRDADEARPLVGARVVLERADEELVALTDEDGSFSFEEVPDGAWRLTASAVGHEPRSAPIEVPHRGAWGDLRVHLRSLRQAALAGYRPLAEALSPERRWWAFWTPRELARNAPDPTAKNVVEVTHAVERALYARDAPSTTEVGAITATSDDLARRVAPRQRPPAARR